MKTLCLLASVKHRILNRFWLRTLALVLFVTPQTYAVSSTQWRTFNLDTVNNYVIPGYQTLSEEAGKLLKATEELCAKPSKPEQALQVARQSYHKTMDAWQHIQNIQFGPIQILMRNYSMQFWPDKKNHVAKHLAQLIASQDTNALSDSEFHKASVSIKGLPAIERLLFDIEDSKALLKREFHCQVLVRISAYTAQSAADLSKEWLDMKQNFIETQGEDSYFEDDMDAATSLLKTLVEPLEVIRDLKVLRPLGSAYGQQKASRLESWRSERSLRNIQINLDSLYSLYSGINSATETQPAGLSALLDKETDTAIKQQFSLIHQQLSDIPVPVAKSIETEAGYKALVSLADSLKTLHGLLESAVSKLDIHLGFNSRDGD